MFWDRGKSPLRSGISGSEIWHQYFLAIWYFCLRRKGFIIYCNISIRNTIKIYKKDRNQTEIETNDMRYGSRCVAMSNKNGVDCGRLSRNPLFRNSSNWNHRTKSSTYSTNVMAVIRTSQQNDVVLEKRSNYRNFLRKKSGQSSEIDEESVVVFCLAAYVLT